MLKKIRKSDSGFTIIEIMIVLAIAALILLIVLLAVPALQRNSRNTQRKNEVGQLAASVSNYVSNNNGTLPNSSGTLATAIADAKLNFYSSSNVYYGSNSNIPNSATNGGNGNATTLTTEDVIFISGAVCSGNTATTSGASNRAYVLIYAVEGANAATPQCAGS